MKNLCSMMLFAALVSIPNNVAAQAYDSCSCVTPPSTEGGVGFVSSSVGEVLINGQPVSQGSSFDIGSEILTGDGSARISVGASCSELVGPNTQALISQPGGAGSNLCVQTTENTPPPPTPTNPDGTALLVGAGVAGGIAGIAALGDDDQDPASP